MEKYFGKYYIRLGKFVLKNLLSKSLFNNVFQKLKTQ